MWRIAPKPRPFKVCGSVTNATAVGRKP